LEHYPNTAARMSLAARLDLPYSDSMQDWEYEVAQPERLTELLSVYASAELSDDERFSLMRMLVQCVEEIEPDGAYEAAWSATEPLLAASPELHRSTIAYWAQLGPTDSEELFRVSPGMRKLWSSISA